MKKIAFLGIDLQNDFCDPSGSLFVPGAEEDVKRIGAFLKRNKSKIDYIGLTQDSHQVIDIAHPAFWQDADGNFPPPFTAIFVADAESGKWSPRYMASLAIQYLKDLEAQGEFVNVIWPEHCLVGSTGCAIHSEVLSAVFEWARLGKFYQIVQKGQFPLTEHFGAFRAQIPFPNQPSTQINFELVQILEKYDEIYFAGEAYTHCVANTLKQSMDFPNLAKKLIVLEDCMSPVPGGPTPAITFTQIAQPIYDSAKAMGIPFVKSIDITL